MEPMQTEFWYPVPGQLREGEQIGMGHRDKTEAKKIARSINQKVYAPTIRLLNTVESEIAADDPKFSPDKLVFDQRWCVVVRSINRN